MSLPHNGSTRIQKQDGTQEIRWKASTASNFRDAFLDAFEFAQKHNKLSLLRLAPGTQKREGVCAWDSLREGRSCNL